MWKILSLILCLMIVNAQTYATTVSGGVEKNGTAYSNRIIDSETNTPVADAKVALPQKRYTTYTDDAGAFELNTNINDNTIMSIEKEGYKPYSITLNAHDKNHPIIIGIEKTNGQNLQISNDLIHLGDDNFSDTSASASEFKTTSKGPYITKQFKMAANALSRTNYLLIGSIIGIDTILARSMGQNRVVNAYSSPPEVFFNGNKIAEIQLNGDGQKIKIPRNLVRPNQINEITIRTGRNMAQKAYVDYDDIELMNLSIVSE